MKINNLAAKAALVSKTLQDLAEKVNKCYADNESTSADVIMIYDWLVVHRFCKPILSHDSVKPPVELMIDIVDGCPFPRKFPFEYINWAMDYTDNCMFVDINSDVHREHFNILQEACRKYLNDKTC